jgi:hypothetical protein
MSTTRPYPEPDQSSSCPSPSPILFLEDPFEYYPRMRPRSPKLKGCLSVVYFEFLFMHFVRLEWWW